MYIHAGHKTWKTEASVGGHGQARCRWMIMKRNLKRRPVPLAVRSKAWVCGPSPAEIVGSNPAVVRCDCCVLSGRGLCDELITRPEESYRLWCVVVCDLETSRMRRPWPALGRSTIRKKNLKKMEDVDWVQLSRGGVQWQWKPLIKFSFLNRQKKIYDKMRDSKLLNYSDLRISYSKFLLLVDVK